MTEPKQVIPVHVERPWEAWLKLWTNPAILLIIVGAVYWLGSEITDIRRSIQAVATANATLATSTQSDMSALRTEQRDMAREIAEALRRVAVQENVGDALQRQLDFLFQRMGYSGSGVGPQ